MIYLVILNDEPIEIWSAWSSMELAEAEIERYLNEECHTNHDFYWFNNRLSVKIMHVDITPKEV